MFRRLFAFFSLTLLAACGKELPTPITGPVLAPDTGQLCGVRSDDEVVRVAFFDPRDPDMVREVNEPSIAPATEGLRVSIFRSEDVPESIRVEMLDAETCNPRVSFEARLVRQADDELGYLVPLEEIDSALEPGAYVASVSSGNIVNGAVGSVVQYSGFGVQPPPKCEGELVLDEEVAFGKSGGEREFAINRESPGDLCLDIQAQSDFWVIRDLRINEQRVYPPNEDVKDRGHYVVRYPGRAFNYRVKVALAKGSARIVARVKNTAIGIAEPGIDCGGRLEGYDDPFVNTDRRLIKRGQVWVTCTAVYESSRKFVVENDFGWVVRDRVVTRITTPAVTNEYGEFEGSISPGAIQRAGVSKNHTFKGVESDCLLDEQCGVERVGTHQLNRELGWWLPIRNVPDVTFDGLVARLVTSSKMPAQNRPDVGRVTRFLYRIMPFLDSGDANDLPVVVHEAFDPLLEDGTEGLVWALGGQPTDYSKPGDASKVRESNRVGVIRGACFTRHNQLFANEIVDPMCAWTESCPSSAQSQSDRFRCEGVNVLKILLEEGYDVWLVDHVRRDPTVLELATRAPVLYQRIADFPSPEWMGRPQRRLSVVGLSMGGVVARIGVRLWELKDRLGRLGANSELQIIRSDLVRDSAEDRVALYVSYEAPHHGTKIPLGFQALIKDGTNPSRLNFFDLLNSRAAEQLTVPFVRNSIDTNCIKSGKPKDCTLGPQTISPAHLTEFESALLQFLSEAVLDALDSLPPRPSISSGFPRISFDGIPKRVPAIAVANGQLRDGFVNVQGRLADIKVVKKALWIDELVPDDHIKLDDSFDPAGSGLDQIYRLKELETSGREYLIFTGELKADVHRRPTFVATGSALALDIDGALFGPKEVALRWDDALAQRETRSHFNVDDRQCTFLMYHLDGKMKGDLDGYPACGAEFDSCASGRRIPGMVVAPDGITGSQLGAYCDPNDSDPGVLPPGVRDLPIRWANVQFDPDELKLQNVDR